MNSVSIPPSKQKQVQKICLFDAPLRGPQAGGAPLSNRKLTKVTFLRYLDEAEAAQETPDTDLPFPEPVDVTPPPDDDDDIPEVPVKKSAPKTEKKATDSDDNGEDWGIQPDLGF